MTMTSAMTMAMTMTNDKKFSKLKGKKHILFILILALYQNNT